ncbi:hypothetical protein [Sphingomonas jaspsi]|uniref:hypothetical protein n=1 Tax=Sphingomonas jaspsi TaxID=392409 RepID=UPI0004AEA068|nr:hypothetical protein [Sphingomonas jaspsi]
MDTQPVRAPMHLWIVGLLALIWNGFGAFDYVMTRTRGADYIRSMMPSIDADGMMAYINAFPIWVSVGWGLGVWGGLLGSILLLARNRLAVPILGLSFIGAIAGLGYQLMHPVDIAGANDGANAVMPYVIIGVALLLFVYARRQAARAVLR